MDEIIAQANAYYISTINWLEATLFSYESLTQLVIVFLLLVLSSGIAYWLGPFIDRLLKDRKLYQKTEKFWKALYLPLTWWLMVLGAWQIADGQNSPVILLRMATSFISVWVVLRLVTLMIESEGFSTLIRITTWSLAILNVFGWLGPFITFLDVTTFSLGGNVVASWVSLPGLPVWWF